MMARSTARQSDLFDDLNAGESAGMIMGRIQPRLAGMCTALALVCWMIGGYDASREVARNFLMINIGYLMGVQPPQPPPVEYDGSIENAADARAAVQQYREAKDARRLEYARQILAFKNQQRRHQKVQGVTMAVWAVVTILTGVMMLCSAVAGLMGSPRTRRWHALTAGWIAGATLTSMAGFYVLFKWGGFPPPNDYFYLTQKLFVQLSYGILIAIGLLWWRRPQAIHDPTPMDQAHIAARLREPDFPESGSADDAVVDSGVGEPPQNPADPTPTPAVHPAAALFNGEQGRPLDADGTAIPIQGAEARAGNTPRPRPDEPPQDTSAGSVDVPAYDGSDYMARFKPPPLPDAPVNGDHDEDKADS